MFHARLSGWTRNCPAVNFTGALIGAESYLEPRQNIDHVYETNIRTRVRSPSAGHHGRALAASCRQTRGEWVRVPIWVLPEDHA